MEVTIVAALHGHGLRAESGIRSRGGTALQVPASIAEFERGVLQEVIGGGGLRLLQLEIVEVGRARAAAHAEGDAAGRRRGRERGGHALPAVFDGGGRAGIRQQDGLLRASALHDGLQPRAAAPAQVGAGGEVAREGVGLPGGERYGAGDGGCVAAACAVREVEIQAARAVAAVFVVRDRRAGRCGAAAGRGVRPAVLRFQPAVPQEVFRRHARRADARQAVILLAALCGVRIGSGGAAEDARDIRIGGIGGDGAAPVVEDDLEADVVICFRQLVRAERTVARAVFAVPALDRVAGHMRSAVEGEFIELVNGAVRVVGIPDAVIGLAVVRAVQAGRIVGVVQLCAVRAEDVIELADARGVVVMELCLLPGLVADAEEPAIRVVDQRGEVFDRSVLVLAADAGQAVKDLVCRAPAFAVRGVEVDVVITIINAVAVGVLCVGQDAVAEEGLVAVVVRYGEVRVAGVAVRVRLARHLQAEAVLVPEDAVRFGSAASLLREIVLRAVGVRVDPVEGLRVVRADADGLDALLRGELPAGAEQHIAVVARIVGRLVGVFLLLHTEGLPAEAGVVHERQPEGHHAAIRREQRHDEGQALHVVRDIAGTGAARTLGLVGVVALQAEVVAVGHREIRRTRLERGDDALARAAVRAQQDRMAFPAAVPAAGRAGDIQRAVAVRTGQADEILRRGFIMIRSVCINFIPRQGLDPVAVLLASRLVNCQLVGVQVLEIVGRDVAEAGL